MYLIKLKQDRNYSFVNARKGRNAFAVRTAKKIDSNKRKHEKINFWHVSMALAAIQLLLSSISLPFILSSIHCAAGRRTFYIFFSTCYNFCWRRDEDGYRCADVRTHSTYKVIVYHLIIIGVDTTIVVVVVVVSRCRILNIYSHSTSPYLVFFVRVVRCSRKTFTRACTKAGERLHYF